jgi:NADH-quinone oxidoreductase subunit C
MDIHSNIPINYGRNADRFKDRWGVVIQLLRDHFADGVLLVEMPGIDKVDIPTITFTKEVLVAALVFLKDKAQAGYDFLTDLTAVDDEVQLPLQPRFQLVYHLMSTQDYSRLRIKVRVAEGEEVPSAIPVWRGANWAEREVFDMFGIVFTDHPNLKRILMDQRWVGHPLRKDYPLRGYQSFVTPEPIDQEQLE